MVTRPCPLCGRAECQPYLTTGDTTFGFAGTFQVVRCPACTMLYTNPQVAPEDLHAFYPPDYSAHASDRAHTQKKHPRGRDPWDVLPEVGQKRLLDVGCGSGAYLLRQQDAGWRVFGVEPSTRAVLAARALGLEVIEGAIPGAKLPQEQFEVITMLGVLDHLPEPAATLRALRGMTAPQGRLIVSVPNAASAAAALFGADWPGWDLPRHQNHFAPMTLRQLIQRAGFDQVRLLWKRRTKRWQEGARLRRAATGALGWKLLARSRTLCSYLAALRSRGERSDEIVAVAVG